MASRLNMTHAYDPKRVKHLGKHFSTIDFQMNEGLNGETIRKQRSDTVVGSLLIGDREYKLTLAEIDRLIETLHSAKDVFSKSYALGRYH